MAQWRGLASVASCGGLASVASPPWLRLVASPGGFASVASLGGLAWRPRLVASPGGLAWLSRPAPRAAPRPAQWDKWVSGALRFGLSLGFGAHFPKSELLFRI